MDIETITNRFADIVSRVTNCASPTLAIDLRPSYGGYMAVVSEALTWPEVEVIADAMRPAGFSLRMHGGAATAILTYEDGSTAIGFSFVFDLIADWEERRASDFDQLRFTHD